MKKIIKCLTCGKEVERNENARFCHECSQERPIIYREVKEVGSWVIFSRDEFRCAYCGKSSIEDGVRLVLDHIIPYVDSKDNTVYNLVTSCFECNMHKGAMRLPQAVYERIIKRNIERNHGISKEKQQELNELFEKYYTAQKGLRQERLKVSSDAKDN